jgi:hypothetical protein
MQGEQVYRVILMRYPRECIDVVEAAGTADRRSFEEQYCIAAVQASKSVQIAQQLRGERGWRRNGAIWR